MAHNHSHDHGHDHSHGETSTSVYVSPVQAGNIREKQGPIKESYKSDPSKALITLKSSGTLDSQNISCSLDGPNAEAIKDAHKKVAGLHWAAGGDESGASGELCSGDMLLEALVACSGVTLKAVATALQIPLESGKVYAEGDLDFRGTLGVDKEAPVGFTKIRLGFDLKMEKGKEVEEEKLEKLGKLTERYCVVLQTIAKKPELVVRIDGTNEPEPGLEKNIAWAQKV